MRPGPGGTHGRRRRAPALLAIALAVAPALAGCTSALGERAASGAQTNYIGNAGATKWITPRDRGRPVALTGTTADGSRVDVAAWRGDVVVINVWFAGCGPCRAEAPALAGAARSAGSGVHFLGIDTVDSASVVQAFQTRFSLPYPSVLDADSGAAVLALRGTLPASAVPATVILDRRGRPAARILGGVDPAVLTGWIQDVQANTLTPHVSVSSTTGAGT